MCLMSIIRPAKEAWRKEKFSTPTSLNLYSLDIAHLLTKNILLRKSYIKWPKMRCSLKNKN